MIEARAQLPPRWIFVAIGVGAYAALVASAPSPTRASVLAAPLALAVLIWWTLVERHRWMGAFVGAALLLPPLPIPMGNSGPHSSLLFAALGIFAGVLYLGDWHFKADSLSRAFLCLFSVLLASVIFAAFHSGVDLALESLARVLSGSALYFFDYTEGVFSGRFESWRVLLSFLIGHPWHAVFGVGYKTLPYSDYIGQTVIADNMYLSMLVETGVVGLAALLALNLAILRAARRAARNSSPSAAFFGTWIFCFWVGLSFQVLSADLLTYWRVLPVYFLVLAWAVRESSKAPAQ